MLAAFHWDVSIVTQYEVYQCLLMILNRAVQFRARSKSTVKFIVEFQTFGLQLLRADQICN